MENSIFSPIQKPRKNNKGIALILTLGVLFMMGLIVGSFAFFATSSNKNTTEFINTITATNLANSGYNYMVGAIQDFFGIVLPIVTKDRTNQPDSKDNLKIRSNEFNSLQSALTAFLGGETVTFTNYKFIPEETAITLDEVIFKNSNSWAVRYGFLPEASIEMGQYKYTVDLDGINNYVYTTSNNFTESIQWQYAKSILQISDDGSQVATDAAATFALAPQNIANEQRDADWHILKNEQDKLFGRFAVMAKDQSSLINLESKLSNIGIDELIQTMDMNDPSGSLTPDEVAEKRTEVSQNLQGSPNDLNDVMNALEINPADTSNGFTTSSSDNTKRIDVNTSDPKAFFQYLSSEYDPTWDDPTVGPSPDQKMAIRSANAKISVNLFDYRDPNCIPYALSRYSWDQQSIDTASDPWQNLDNSDLFYGIEGMRISEVMMNPEQSFVFDGVLKLDMTATAIKASPDPYFYEAGGASLVTANLYEAQRDAGNKKWNLTTFENSATVDEGTVSIKLDTPLQITNPGGFYQVWIKVKVTAKNQALGDAAKVKYTALMPKIIDPDITVKWSSTPEVGTQSDIEEKSIVTNLSATLQAEYAATKGASDPDFIPGETTLSQLYQVLDGIKDDNSIVISGTMDSDLQTVINNQMNLPKGSATSQPANVQINWDPSKNNPTKSGTGDDLVLANADPEKDLSLYPFGSRVLEIAMYDEGAGRAESGTPTQVLDTSGNPIMVKNSSGDLVPLMSAPRSNAPRDELIGMFYCYNTNGFKEDDAHQPINPVTGAPGDGNWKAEDGDYLWFCSMGVPSWLPYDQLPEWMQAKLPDSAQKADLFNTSNGFLHTNGNACVFPRRDVKLKLRFRMVDLSDSRFNAEEFYDDVSYKLGVLKISYSGNTFTNTDDLDSLAGQQSIVSRPQWEDGDEVSVEIKEILATQQVYSTSVLETLPTDADPNPAPVTYRILGETVDGLDQLQTIPAPVEEGKFLYDQTLYYRNQRLEKNNRAANELHAAEYVEFFNGTAQDVKMNGWILKIEQYKIKKLPDNSEEYQLLGPRYPDVIFKPGAAPGTPGTYEVTAFSSSRPDYILLSTTTIPANDGVSKLPYALITNQVNSAVFNGYTEVPQQTSGIQTFTPLGFNSGFDPVLGKIHQRYSSPDEGFSWWPVQLFSINLQTAWNYNIGEEQQLTICKTSNISPAPGQSTPLEWRDAEAGSMSYNPLFPGKAWPFVFNSLHFRDDADRVVLTLFAPKNPAKRFSFNNGKLEDQGDLIYTPIPLGQKRIALNGVPPQSDQPHFGLIEEQEWLTAHPDAVVDGQEMAGTYALIDRAIIDHNFLEPNTDPSISSQEGSELPNHPNDWIGNRSVFLNRFYTNPLLTRMGIPGSLANPTPFDDNNSLSPGFPVWSEPTPGNPEKTFVSSNAEIAKLATDYWSPHKQVFKSKPGPLGYGTVDPNNSAPGYVLTARGSPSQPDYIHTEFFDTFGNLQSDLSIPASNIYPDLPVNDVLAMNSAGMPQSCREILSFGGGFYDQEHTGYGSYNHQIFSYFYTKTEGAFIKDSPLSSVAELCDVPAPFIENNPLFTTVMADQSLENAFVNGLESSAQYMSKDQKRMVFSAASADSTLLHPSVATKFGFLNTTPTNSDDVTQESYNGYPLANPLVLPGSGASASYANWILQYTFYATVPDKVTQDYGKSLPTRYKTSFLPGRYKIFIEGLNPSFPIAEKNGDAWVSTWTEDNTSTWDVIKSIAIVTDGTINEVTTGSAQTNDLKIVKRVGLAVVKGPNAANPAIRDIKVLDFNNNAVLINPENILQLLPSNGDEYFNIQNSIEVNFFSDTDTDSGSKVLAKSWDYKRWQPDYTNPIPNKLQQLLTEVTTSSAFQGIRIHLVPREDVGKVNINTAPLHVLLRVPGFARSVEQVGAVDPNNPKGDDNITQLIQGAANEIVQDIYQATHPTIPAVPNDPNSIPESYSFKDAGELLVYTNQTGPRNGSRIFPFQGNDVKDPKYQNDSQRAALCDAKARIFREAFPFIQFAGSSFEIVSLGQAVQPHWKDVKEVNVLSSNKIAVTVNLGTLLKNLADQFVTDPTNIGKNTFFNDGGQNAVTQAIKAKGVMIVGDYVQQSISNTGSIQYWYYPAGSSKIQVPFTDSNNPSVDNIDWQALESTLYGIRSQI